MGIMFVYKDVDAIKSHLSANTSLYFGGEPAHVRNHVRDQPLSFIHDNPPQYPCLAAFVPAKLPGNMPTLKATYVTRSQAKKVLYHKTNWDPNWAVKNNWHMIPGRFSGYRLLDRLEGTVYEHNKVVTGINYVFDRAESFQPGDGNRWLVLVISDVEIAAGTTVKVVNILTYERAKQLVYYPKNLRRIVKPQKNKEAVIEVAESDYSPLTLLSSMQCREVLDYVADMMSDGYNCDDMVDWLSHHYEWDWDQSCAIADEATKIVLSEQEAVANDQNEGPPRLDVNDAPDYAVEDTVMGVENFIKYHWDQGDTEVGIAERLVEEYGYISDAALKRVEDYAARHQDDGIILTAAPVRQAVVQEEPWVENVHDNDGRLMYRMYRNDTENITYRTYKVDNELVHELGCLACGSIYTISSEYTAPAHCTGGCGRKFNFPMVVMTKPRNEGDHKFTKLLCSWVNIDDEIPF